LDPDAESGTTNLLNPDLQPRSEVLLLGKPALEQEEKITRRYIHVCIVCTGTVNLLPLIQFFTVDVESFQAMVFLYYTEYFSIVP
jgi:hypothetical protein